MQHYGHNPVSSFWKRKPAAFFHIFMNGCTACINSLTAKIHLHGTIFIHVFMRMINITNVSFYPSFIAMTVCFPIFQIIIICIWIETKLFLEPSQSKVLMVILDKAIKLSSIFFAKNAVSFFRSRFSSGVLVHNFDSFVIYLFPLLSL